MAALSRIAMWGVCHRLFTVATALGKIPSSDQANMSLETANSMAGRSLMRATNAPETIATVQAGERSVPSNPGAVRSRN